VKAAGVWSIAKQTALEFLDDSPFQLAAALSFYTLLSLSPLVLVVVSTAGLLWGETAVRTQLVQQIEGLVGPAGAETVRTVLEHVDRPGRNWSSITVGVVTLLFGATTVFGQLQASLNQIWNVQAVANRRVIWSLIRTRLLALMLVLASGFVLLVSLVVSAALAALHSYLAELVPTAAIVWRAVNAAVSLVIVGLLIALIYRALPDVRIGWRYVWLGALFTDILFGAGKYLIGLYLGHASVGSAYGAAGSLVVFLVWVYYSALILFLGAELTQVYARHRGAWITPVEHAAPVGSPEAARGEAAPSSRSARP
jgi:membrane protein